MQIVAPGVLEMTERPIPAPGPDEVLVRIEACGVCGADLRDAEKAPQAGQPGPVVRSLLVTAGEPLLSRSNLIVLVVMIAALVLYLWRKKLLRESAAKR